MHACVRGVYAQCVCGACNVWVVLCAQVQYVSACVSVLCMCVVCCAYVQCVSACVVLCVYEQCVCMCECGVCVCVYACVVWCMCVCSVCLYECPGNVELSGRGEVVHFCLCSVSPSWPLCLLVCEVGLDSGQLSL